MIIHANKNKYCTITKIKALSVKYMTNTLLLMLFLATIEQVSSAKNTIPFRNHLTARRIDFDQISPSCENITFEQLDEVLEIYFEEKYNNFPILKAISEMDKKIVLIAEKVRDELGLKFEETLKSPKDSMNEDMLFRILMIDHFLYIEKEVIENLQDHIYATAFQYKNTISYLMPSEPPNEKKGDTLYEILSNITDKRNAVPQNTNDELAYAYLYTLYYGTHTYMSMVFFTLEQYSFLADHFFDYGDFQKYNKYLDLIQTTFDKFKYSLLGNRYNKPLLDNVISTMNEVQSKNFVKNNEDNIKTILNGIDVMTSVKTQFEEMKLPIIADKPKKLTKLDFKESQISTPMGRWRNGGNVSYAIQYMENDMYSKIGRWSNPTPISEKSNPLLHIPNEMKGKTKLIFRMFNNDKDYKPELVGVLGNNETVFRDIDRDLYDAASGIYHDVSVNEANILINNGANINAVFEDGRKSIHAAARSGNVQLAKQFLIGNNKTDINEQDKNGYGPLHIAARHGNDEFIELLIEQGANVNSKTNSEMLTPLHIVSFTGFTSTINALLKSKTIDVNAKQKEGFTPLHSAATLGSVELVEALLSNANIEVNAKSKDGLTPLHLSTIYKHADVVEKLLKTNNIDKDAKTICNWTALDFATMADNKEIIKLLTS